MGSFINGMKIFGAHKIPFLRAIYWKLYVFLWKFREKIRLLKLPNKDLVLPCLGMQIMVRNPRQSVIGRSILQSGVWESEVTDFILPRIKHGMTVLDVGGDIGYFTLLFAKQVGPDGRVLVFEPYPQVKQYLDSNKERNRLNQVITFDFALSDKAGQVILEAPYKKSRINLEKESLSKDDVKVEMKVYDDWSQEQIIEKIDLVKIDVEGAELNVLKGMEKTLQQYHPAILVEVHPKAIRQFGYQADDLANFLKFLGYQGIPVDQPSMEFGDDNVTIYWDFPEN